MAYVAKLKIIKKY